LKSTKSASELETDELIRNLGRFPAPVLPSDVLCELQSRGDAIHDSLVAVVREVIDSVAGGGLGGKSNSTFFAFALLVPIARKDDQALIESLLTLPEKSRDTLFGDLDTEAMPHLIASLFRGQSAAEMIGWCDRLADHPKLDELHAFPLFRCLTLAVTNGDLDRITAIDALVKRLETRADRRDDLQSAVIVCELMDLSARDVEAADAAVRSSFQRGQIDRRYVGIDSWDDIDSHRRFRGDKTRWADPAAELSTWCYDYVSDDCDPVEATFRVNPQASRLSRLSESSALELIQQLQQSTDEQYPRDAVDSLAVAFADAYHATIEMIRAELAQVDRGLDAQSGNGAYLGLVLIIADEMPLPTDLVQAILGLPQHDREQIFGDQFELIVQSVALTPLRQHDFIEQWIWDSERSNADRREMVEYYLRACYHHVLDRKVAIEALVAGLRRALLDEPILIAPYAEMLACFTPKAHQQLLDDAFQREDAEWSVPLKTLRRMAQDAEFAKDCVRKEILSYRGVQQMITDGVMFRELLYREKPADDPRPAAAYQPPPRPRTETTIRSDERTPRNALCPCGSGKKYKKCCLR
jgi:hypothetical protein